MSLLHQWHPGLPGSTLLAGLSLATRRLFFSRQPIINPILSGQYNRLMPETMARPEHPAKGKTFDLSFPDQPPTINATETLS